MKNKIVGLVGLSLLVALAGCTDNKESAKETTKVPPMTETSHRSTETEPVTESTPNTEGVTESTSISTEPEVEEPTELMDSTAEELIASKKENANGYEVTKSSITLKTKKQKGEVIDSWYIASVEMNYDLDE